MISASEQYANNHRKLEYVRKLIQLKARDHTRTPMQWDASANAGFCKEGVKPWMRVNDDYSSVNVQKQLEDPHSVLSYWKRCIEHRKSHKDVFVYGGFQILDSENKDVVAFRRFSTEESWITITNFTGKHLKWSGLGDLKVLEWVIGNYPLETHGNDSEHTISLKPWEGIIGRCSAPKR